MDTEEITITDAVVDKVRQLMTDDTFKDEHIEGLRIYVQGGGCSGFSYGFVFENEIAEDDSVFEKGGYKFLVDSMSMMYLVGSTINYDVDLLHEQFVVNNPNAQTTCGCGSSFNVE